MIRTPSRYASAEVQEMLILKQNIRNTLTNQLDKLENDTPTPKPAKKESLLSRIHKYFQYTR